MHTSGTLSLDGTVPAQVNTAPSVGSYWYTDASGTNHARYTVPMSLWICIAVSWDLAPTSDIFIGETLDPYFGADFIDHASAKYSPHYERVHLMGQIEAVAEGGNRFLSTIPVDAAAGLDGALEYDTIVNGAIGPLVCRVAPPTSFGYLGSAEIVSDGPMKPTSQSAPLTFASPPQNRFGINYNASANGRQFWGVPTPVSIADGAALPSFTVNLSTLLAECTPTPQWFIVNFGYTLQTPGNFSVGWSIASSPGTLTDNSGAFVSPTGWSGAFGAQGWLTPPASNYLGPHLLLTTSIPGPPGSGTTFTMPIATSIIWQAGQATSITVTVGGTAVEPGGSIGISYGMTLMPLYELRQHGVHAGDLIDLTGAGWPGVLGAPLLIGNLTAGNPAAGLVKLPYGGPLGSNG